ncbi:MAG: type II secretion system protein, partial [Plesiomonas shigelloides]
MPARGFTLLELMLVVFLLGLTAGGVLMTLPP